MRGANFDHAVMTFSRFAGADLRGANLADTDLSRADFTGADLTDADFTGADLDGATLLGVKGLDTVKGLPRRSTSTRPSADRSTSGVPHRIILGPGGPSDCA